MIRRLLFLCCLTFPAYAHDSPDPDHPHAHAIPAAVERNIVEITEGGAYRYINSNGIPDHKTGAFPNSGNPNSISAQSHKYRVPLNPEKTKYAVAQNGVIGVALNGIPFEPGTAECYGQARGSRPNPNCEWREEAIINRRGKLGLDSSNAHVQPNGTYHYHGVPHGLLDILSGADLVHVGYAADGFKLMVSRSGKYKPSYRLKDGTRRSGPGGAYDGTYTADYAFVAGEGNLDQCNGTDVNGEYAYFVTEDFPFAPRCMKGTVDNSFARRGPPSGNMGGRRPPLRHRPPPPHLR